MQTRPPNHKGQAQAQAQGPVPRRLSACARGYGRTWEKLAALVLAAEPLCRLCGNPAECVDHIVARNRGGTDELSNLQPLCNQCHSAKTVSEDGGLGR